MLSFLYPIHNRAALLARTLDTFVLQRDPGAYEILVLDDGSTDHVQDVVRYYRDAIPARFRLPLHYLRLDVTRCGLPVGQPHNPAVAWNVGIRQAQGRWVAISSPEVCHRTTHNVHDLNAYRPEHVAVVADVYDRAWADTEFGGWIGGGPRQRPLCFLARFDRAFLLRIGGFEERFMAGRSYDDNEFAERFTANGGVYEFTAGAVVAEHLPHPRAEPGPADDVNRRTYEALRGQRVANVGHEWGSAACVVEQW
jgi:glycosyltransferase involved in cell wall biosynthesis